MDEKGTYEQVQRRGRGEAGVGVFVQDQHVGDEAVGGYMDCSSKIRSSTSPQKRKVSARARVIASVRATVRARVIARVRVRIRIGITNTTSIP